MRGKQTFSKHLLSSERQVLHQATNNVQLAMVKLVGMKREEGKGGGEGGGGERERERENQYKQ